MNSKNVESFIASMAMLTGVASAETHPFSELEWPRLTILPAPTTNIWAAGVGSGFHANVQSIGLSLGGSFGLAKFGSHQAHDLTLASFSYSHMLGPVWGGGHWYRGNWEFRAELFGGVQIHPDENWIVGVTPHFRYNFATGTPLIPFADFGAGVSATGICSPDLGSCFQFNEQAGLGTHWFLSDNIALTIEALYLHISNAGIREPNCGVNGIKGMIGLTLFF